MIYVRLLLTITVLISTACAIDITASSNKEEALTLAKKTRGTCKIEKAGIGDGKENGAIYPFSRWTVKIYHITQSYYQPILYLDNNRQDMPGKYCAPYYISYSYGSRDDTTFAFVASLMGLGVNYEKE